jgi:hypothetical protein
VIPIGDEDLLTGNQVMVALALGARAYGAQVRAGLRFRQVHRSGPLARNHFPQEARLQLLGTVEGDSLDRALGQHRTQREGHVGAVDHLLYRSVHQPGQTHAAVLRLVHGPVPAPFDEGGVGLPPTVRRAHDAVDQSRALAVSFLIDRRQDLAGKPGGFLEDGRNHVGGRFLETWKSGDLFDAAEILEYKPHFAKGCCICHDCAPILSCPTAALKRRPCITAAGYDLPSRSRARSRS